VHNQNPQPPGPAVSPSRTVFQRLTNELPRNFPCPFGHAPVLFHLARFHQKPPKPRSAPTHARRKSCNRSREACVTLCHLGFDGPRRLRRGVDEKDFRPGEPVLLGDFRSERPGPEKNRTSPRVRVDVWPKLGYAERVVANGCVSRCPASLCVWPRWRLRSRLAARKPQLRHLARSDARRRGIAAYSIRPAGGKHRVRPRPS